MLEPRPTRRDPRLLVIERRDVHSLRYAALDAWEVRAVGTISTDLRTIPFTFARLLLQVKPSVVACANLTRTQAHLVVRGARARGLACLVLSVGTLRALRANAPTRDALRKQYRELYARDLAGHGPTLRLTAALLAERVLPSRRYASRLPLRPSPAVDP